MKNIFRNVGHIFLFMVSFVIIHPSHGQVVSTKGKDFCFGFMSNIYGPGGSPYYVYISSAVNNSGLIEVPGIGWSQTFTVAANSTTKITLPTVEPPKQEGLFNLAVHVTTCDSAVVYAQLAGSATNDATVIYPTPALGDKYMVLNMTGSPGDWGDEVLIVATQNNTQIQITPSVTTTGGKPAGVPTIITLNQGETYQLLHTPGGADLSGTIIESVNPGQCVPFAVFSGSNCINIGGCTACDHLYEQLLPLNALGKEYILVPLAGKSQTWYRVLGTVNGTQISINGGAPINLNAGQVYQFNNNVPSYLNATQPVMVMQYSQGGSCDGTGDPFQILMYPVEQSIDNITFNAFQTPIINTYWVNIVVKTSSLPNITLDGNNIAAQFNPVPSNPLYSYARVNVTQANHTLICPGGLLAYVYGWGSYESFGYCAGAAVSDLTNVIYATPNPTCAFNPINFSTPNDPNTQSYLWDFGDGSPQVSGINAVHSYGSQGVFTVTLYKDKITGCDVVVTKNISIINPPLQIIQNDTSVCYGESLTLSVLANNDSVPVYNINGCGDTVISYVAAYFDSIVWSTGDTGAMMNFIPTQDTTIYVYGYQASSICYGVDSIHIIVSKPIAGFQYNSQCVYDSLCFQDSSTPVGYPITSWSWNYGDGSPISSLTNPCHLFPDSGNFNVSLIVTDQLGCKDTVNQLVYVHPQPVVNFTYNNVCVHDTAKFTNLSLLAAGYVWDFGDASTSTQTNPGHLYSSADTFNVQLIAYTSFGCYDTLVQPIIIYPQPLADFNFLNNCFGVNSNFYDNSSVVYGNITGWSWNFGDNPPGTSGVSNPSYLYNNHGSYNVTLITTTNFNCKDTVIKTIYIHPLPQPDFTFQNICVYDQAQFNNISQIPYGNIIAYQWDFGDGNTSAQTSPSHSYNPFGMYTVKLVAYTDSGCADSVTHNIYVSPQPVADFTVADDCRDVPAQFTDQSTVASPHSIVGWNWDFGVNPPAGSTQQNPSYLYPNNGTFNVTLIVTSDSGCTDTITKPTVRYAVPVANFSFTEVCEYDSAIFASTSTINNPGVITQFIWNFGDGSPLVNIQNPKHKYSQCGPYNVTLIVSSANGCVDDTTRTINIHDQPLADFIADTVCVNGPVTSFTDLSTVQCGDVVNGWQWDFNPGMSNLQNPVHDYNQDGYFPVTLIATSSFGCKDTVTKNIRVYEKPQAAFTADTTAYCHPYCTQFTDISTSASTGIVSWDWNFYNGETSQSAMPMICFENESAVLPKYYDVRLIVSNGYGCYDTIVKKNFITVWPKPLADFTFGPQPTDIYESEIDFDNLSIGGDYFTWNFGDGNMSNLIDPVHLYADSGNYLVTLYIENDWGCSDTVSKPLRIEPDFAVFIPNAFTPDGDGDNETFFLKGYGIVEDDFQFMIFNRWGDMIYYTEKFEPWDGKVDGKLAPQGVYIYRIILKDIFDVKHEYIGNVNLIR